jgi:hypothetical protein
VHLVGLHIYNLEEVGLVAFTDVSTYGNSEYLAHRFKL